MNQQEIQKTYGSVITEHNAVELDQLFTEAGMCGRVHAQPLIGDRSHVGVHVAPPVSRPEYGRLLQRVATVETEIRAVAGDGHADQYRDVKRFDIDRVVSPDVSGDPGLPALANATRSALYNVPPEPMNDKEARAWFAENLDFGPVIQTAIEASYPPGTEVPPWVRAVQAVIEPDVRMNDAKTDSPFW